ncbi:extracellular metalloproteinase, putative, partial [Rhizoctonia solani AG-3 Rhs1AP]
MIIPNDKAQATLAHNLNAMNNFFLTHCVRPPAASSGVATAEAELSLHDPRWAALRFMILAHPGTDVVDDLARNFDAHLNLPGNVTRGT